MYFQRIHSILIILSIIVVVDPPVDFHFQSEIKSLNSVWKWEIQTNVHQMYLFQCVFWKNMKRRKKNSFEKIFQQILISQHRSASHRITTGYDGIRVHFCIQQWRFAPDSIFLTFNFFVRRKNSKQPLYSYAVKHGSKVLAFLICFTVLYTRRGKN